MTIVQNRLALCAALLLLSTGVAGNAYANHVDYKIVRPITTSAATTVIADATPPLHHSEKEMVRAIINPPAVTRVCNAQTSKYAMAECCDPAMMK